jgi:cytochrome b pre-mRNA-processing protein 3
MIWSLLKRKKSNQVLVTRQYEAITGCCAIACILRRDERSRYGDLGRFEMITIHLVLYLRRTAVAGGLFRALAQEVLEAFFEDVDHSIRELGIGDAGVPKRMKKFARMFYGRAIPMVKHLKLATRPLSPKRSAAIFIPMRAQPHLQCRPWRSG